MSRTDKDVPYMVAEHYTEHHHWTCATGRTTCTLPDRKDLRSNYYSRRFTACWFEPKHDRVWWRYAAPKWYRDHRWNNPQRVKVRDIAQKTIAEYRAMGEAEDTMPRDQHRHAATWEYW
jgi:hypothetical protein